MGVRLGLLFNILVTVVVPLLLLFYFILKKRRLVRPYLLGAATFIVFQLLTRIPLLQLVLEKQLWFQAFGIQYPWLYLLFFAFTAGLFEEVGRYITMKLFLKKQTEWQDGISFGLGHGGVEALLIVGVTNIALLLNTAYLQTLSFGQVIPAGFERIFAITLHIAWSLLVLESIRKNKKGGLLLAIATHTFVDTLAPGLQKLEASSLVIELVMLLLAAIAMVYIIKNKMNRKVVQKNES